MRREWVVVLALTVWGCGAPADKPGAKPVVPDTVAVDTATVPEAVLSAADARRRWGSGCRGRATSTG